MTTTRQRAVVPQRRRPRPSLGARQQVRALLVLLPVVLILPLSTVRCTNDSGTEPPPISLRDLPPLELDGIAKPLAGNIAPLGEFKLGDAIRLTVTGDAIDAVLVLVEDELVDDAAALAGGGPANQPFDYQVRVPGRYFAFAQRTPSLEPPPPITIAAAPGDPAAAPLARQTVLIVFADGFLTDPGLFDPESGTPDELSFLESINDQVRDSVVARLKTIFRDTPIDIVTETDPAPTAPFSTVTLRPDRVLADDQDFTDTALPLDPSRPECNVKVKYGEVVGAFSDPGNRVLDDHAVVYVGSFQGRGLSCRSAAINSVNNITLGLAHTAAHEIGHLIGLLHVSLTDIMDRSPTLAFQRELTFRRGQIVVNGLIMDPDGTPAIGPITLLNVIQDPMTYYLANFAQ